MLLKGLINTQQLSKLNNVLQICSRLNLPDFHRHVLFLGQSVKCQYSTCAYSANLKSSLVDANTVRKIPGAGIHSEITSDAPDDGESEHSGDHDHEGHIKPALEAHTPIKPAPHFVNIVPGKGPPPEPPVDCCMSGCANCVWIQYGEELKQYFSVSEGNAKIAEALEEIQDPGLKMFLKIELGLL